MTPDGPPIYLSWVSWNGRSAAMSAGLGIEPVYIHGGKGISLPRRYWRQWRQTGAMLRAKRPSAVLVMQPPFFSLLRAWMYAVSTKAKLAADMHTGAFEDPRWKWATPWILRMVRGKGRRAIMTNEPLAARARAAGVVPMICHGYLRPFEAPTDLQFEEGRLRPLEQSQYVLVPLAWAYDEPVDQIVEAARRSPDITWVLTGKAPEDVKAAAPGNVVFSGFVSRPDYERLRARASLVAALTTAEDTMQRSGYEAIEAATPLVTSPMRVLVEYFGDTPMYAKPDAASIEEAVRSTLADLDTHRTAMRVLFDSKVAEQDEALAAIRSWMNA